jgi:hypothetical protein
MLHVSSKLRTYRIPRSKACVEAAQVDLAVEQVVQRMLQRAGQQLCLEVDCQKPWAGVDCLVAGHRGAPVIALQLPCNTCASPADFGDGFPTTSLGLYKGFLLCQANEVFEPRSGSIHFWPLCSCGLLLHSAHAHRVDSSSQVRTGQTTTGH